MIKLGSRLQGALKPLSSDLVVKVTCGWLFCEGALEASRAPGPHWSNVAFSLLHLQLFASTDLGHRWTLLQERVTKDRVYWSVLLWCFFDVVLVE